MSLLLKAECQKALDNLGYPFLSAIMDSDKHIAIVTDCGKPIFHIPNLKLSKTTPNAKEIGLAADEITKFFQRNNKSITRLFDLLTLIDDRDPTEEAKKWNEKYSEDGYEDVVLVCNYLHSLKITTVYARIIQKGIQFNWNESTGFSSITIPKLSSKLTEIPSIRIEDHPMYQDFNSVMKEISDLARFIKERDEIIANFSSCKI